MNNPAPSSLVADLRSDKEPNEFHFRRKLREEAADEIIRLSIVCERENRDRNAFEQIAADHAREVLRLRATLYVVETVMMIVEPRNHKAEYLQVLAKVKEALKVTEGP